MLLDAQAEKPGSNSMPDLFFGHTNNVVALGTDNVINWKDEFTENELSAYVDEFVQDGMAEDKLVVFPVSKSTHLLYINGTEFDKFAADTGVTYDDLISWDGFFEVAAKYYAWSGGKPFCAFDYMLRCVELNAISEGANVMKDRWYDFDNQSLKDSWMEFGNSLTKGHIVVSDLYANTQVMTGEVLCGFSSSAAILYYNDTVTYPDNTTQPLNLQVLPSPQNSKGKPLATQAGVGLCAYKTTEQKQEAASVFAHWLTEKNRNLDFVSETGYMPVTNEGINAISNYQFKNDSYIKLHGALQKTAQNCTIVTEPDFHGYYDKVYKLYDELKNLQAQLEMRKSSGESEEDLAQETWKIFQSVK